MKKMNFVFITAIILYSFEIFPQQYYSMATMAPPTIPVQVLTAPPMIPIGVSSSTDVGSTITFSNTSMYKIDDRSLQVETDRTKVLQQQYDNYVNYIQNFLYTLSSDMQYQFRILQEQFDAARNKSSVLSQQAQAASPTNLRAIVIEMRQLNEIMLRILYNLYSLIYYTGKIV